MQNASKFATPAVLFASGAAMGALLVMAIAGGAGVEKALFSITAPRHCVNQSGVVALFSPGSEAKFVSFVDSARQTLDVEIYQFSYSGLKDALARAAGRGVRVRIILEQRVDSNYETAKFLAGKGVQVKWATKEYANTHSKFAVADGEKVLAGSVNWSRHAMFLNREAALAVEDAAVAAEFARIFEMDWAEGTEYSQ